MKTLRYKKREDQVVTAVQLNLETDGFTYTKWGGKQRCYAGDWLVNNNGEYYTIRDETFKNTYKEVSMGQFEKTTAVWASAATEDGKVKTNEGYTEYKAGDYLVANNEDGSDSYAVSKIKFENMYELAD